MASQLERDREARIASNKRRLAEIGLQEAAKGLNAQSAPAAKRQRQAAAVPQCVPPLACCAASPVAGVKPCEAAVPKLVRDHLKLIAMHGMHL